MLVVVQCIIAAIIGLPVMTETINANKDKVRAAGGNATRHWVLLRMYALIVW